MKQQFGFEKKRDKLLQKGQQKATHRPEPRKRKAVERSWQSETDGTPWISMNREDIAPPPKRGEKFGRTEIARQLERKATEKLRGHASHKATGKSRNGGVLFAKRGGPLRELYQKKETPDKKGSRSEKL